MNEKNDLPHLYLRPGGDKRALRGHPWVYANEIRMDSEAKSLPPGSVVVLHRVDGKPMGQGTFNPHALIAFRFLTRNPSATIDEGFFARRLERALSLRDSLFDSPFYRLIHAEADGMPGLIVDRYGDVLTVQAGTAGMDRLMPEILIAAENLLAPRAIVLRNDGRGRAMEGLNSEVRLAKGELDGPVEVMESGLTFLADPLGGQKTGWFFDQRENRAFVSSLADGTRVLDLYCYGGGFAISAAARGAESVLGIDSSENAVGLARSAAERNGLNSICAFRQGEAFGELAKLDAGGERFGVVVADPPAFVKSRKHLRSGLKGYQKLAGLAAKLVDAGGFLFLASCSHNAEERDFVGAVTDGIRRAGRSGRILRKSGAAPDHPVHPHLPESVYLKAVLLQLD
jgi:23S rRNA (cytosine1962-C5)-methyltransferase